MLIGAMMKKIFLFSVIFFGLIAEAIGQRGPTPVFTKKARSAELVERQSVIGSLRAWRTVAVA